MQVYKRIKDYISERGIKQTVLAQKCGITPNTMSAILTGRRTLYADELEKICKALGVEASTFIPM